ncbi:unnamed protein product [Hydatigera taeniaeformis]|uniref:Uncharacterized protein n=1 Tax=Hydatigena taeniaeformis TaxID=6205 RepID=A0A0R3WY11_HYDTA|nr:unnamed protein product [Hydatigera taeniaeformis]
MQFEDVLSFRFSNNCGTVGEPCYGKSNKRIVDRGWIYELDIDASTHIQPPPPPLVELEAPHGHGQWKYACTDFAIRGEARMGQQQSVQLPGGMVNCASTYMLSDSVTCLTLIRLAPEVKRRIML